MRRTPPFRICWRILPQVSRSFGFVIRCLPRDLDDAVMVSYLLCRVADTIEDSRLPVPEKRLMLARFAERLEAGSPDLPAGGYPENYRGLMTQVEDVLACFRSLPAGTRSLIGAQVTEMCGGMSKWCDREIVTLEDQNDYCYYVAGVVGRLLTSLFHASGRVDAHCKSLLEKHAVDFGLALQKVNIIRDLRADLEDGRCYWPSELMNRHGVAREGVLRPENVSRSIQLMDQMIDDLWDYLGAALRYLMLLPKTQLRLRIFCAIPLFMAVATARRCQQNADVFLGRHAVKIPARIVRSIALRALSLGPFNGYLQSWYRRWRRGEVDRPSPWCAVTSLLP